jgi:hypothetical protein
MHPTDPSPPVNPISAAWNTVARFDDYDAAQRAVDRLSDDGFPVEKPIFGAVAHAATRGQRDFSSVRTLSASHYDLVARGGTVDHAKNMLRQAGLLPDTV